jgi:hypothetical protein
MPCADIGADIAGFLLRRCLNHRRDEPLDAATCVSAARILVPVVTFLQQLCETSVQQTVHYPRFQVDRGQKPINIHQRLHCTRLVGPWLDSP